MRGLILIAGLLTTAVSAAGALDVDLKAYDQARRRGEMVSVDGSSCRPDWSATMPNARGFAS
jgi:hypothetical protein